MIEATHVSTDGWIDKQNVVNTYNGVVFSFKKEGTDTCYSMDEPGRLYAVYTSYKKTNTV